jgi:hypothetical protein
MEHARLFSCSVRTNIDVPKFWSCVREPGRILCGYARKSLETVRDISHMILLDENVSVYPFHHTHLTWTNCVKNIIYTLHNTIVVFSTAISKAFITLIVCSVFLHLVVRLPYKAENGLRTLLSHVSYLHSPLLLFSVRRATNYGSRLPACSSYQLRDPADRQHRVNYYCSN